MRFWRIWMKHAAHNLASAVQNVLHGAAPPQWTGHTDEQLHYIDARTVCQNVMEAWRR